MKPLLRGFFFAVLLAAVQGCTCAADELDPEIPRPFGRRFVHMGHMIADIPATIGGDVMCRLEREADYAVRYLELKGDEFERTGEHITDFFPKLGRDAVCRTERVGDSLGATFSRAWEDLKCFGGRAWHTAKLLE